MKDFLDVLTLTLVNWVINVILKGVALSFLWGWFIVPTFNLPGISIPAAIGIMMTIGLITSFYKGTRSSEPQPDQREHEKEEQTTQKTKNLIIQMKALKVNLIPVMALVLGWIVHLFM